jgi:hypothetical protein
MFFTSRFLSFAGLLIKLSTSEIKKTEPEVSISSMAHFAANSSQLSPRGKQRGCTSWPWFRTDLLIMSRQ